MMNKNVKGFVMVCLALVLGLAGCKKASAPSETSADEGPTIQEQVEAEIQDKSAQEVEPAAEAGSIPEGFAAHETSYLSMGVAPGWTADPYGIAEDDANVEMGEAYLAKGFDVVDDATGTQILVMVYQAAEFPDPIEEPQVGDFITSAEDADPITIGGVELKGYLTSTSTGNNIAEWVGSVNGHFVDILVLDKTEDLSLRTSDAVRSMLESITIK